MDSNNIAIVDSSIKNEIRKQLIEVLLEDPENEIRILAESYLARLLDQALVSGDKNPIVKAFFEIRVQEFIEQIDVKLEVFKENIRNYCIDELRRNDINILFIEIDRLKNDIDRLKYENYISSLSNKQDSVWRDEESYPEGW